MPTAPKPVRRTEEPPAPPPAPTGPLGLVFDDVDGLKAYFSCVNPVTPVTFDFGDSVTNVSDAKGALSHIYSEPGVYSVTATDAIGRTSQGLVMVPAVSINDPQATPAPHRNLP